jgi:hypothetical protein
MTTPTLDSGVTEDCPGWCTGLHSNGAGESAGTLWHEDRGQDLRIASVVDPEDYFDISVGLMERAGVHGSATMSPCIHQNARNEMIWVDLTPTQASQIADMLGMAAAAAVKRGEAPRVLSAS